VLGNAEDVVKEGEDRPGEYIIRRGHMIFPTFKKNFPDYDKPVILLVRDPRDVAVSHSFYFERSLDDVITRMRSKFDPSPSWSDWNAFYKGWTEQTNNRAILMSYEDLLENTLARLADIFIQLGVPDVMTSRVKDAVHRQSFNVRKQFTLDSFPLRLRTMQLKYMRRGEAGVWGEYMGAAQEKRLVSHCREMMGVFNYE